MTKPAKTYHREPMNSWRDELRKANPMAEIANDTYDKCAVIRCWYKKVRKCDGFCRKHWREVWG